MLVDDHAGIHMMPVKGIPVEDGAQEMATSLDMQYISRTSKLR